MILKMLKLSNFRNYESLNLTFSKKINIIYGKNAQGKTNILESIYVLGLTKSHRSFIDNSLILNEKTQAKIKGIIEKNKIETSLEIFFDNKNKKYRVDNNSLKRVSDYISKMNIIIFYPEDLELIKDSPNVRRRFLDLELSQLYNDYYKVLSNYNKLLKIRNDLLKKLKNNFSIDQNYFDIITQCMIEKAIFIYRARNKFLNKLDNIAKIIYKDLTNFIDFNLKYITNFQFESYNEEEIRSKLELKYKKELDTEVKVGTTLYGPHRDDFEFYLGKENLKLFGSQGQQRLAIISLKLAEIDIFNKYSGSMPILLLDDVFSELDDEKKNNLLKYLKKDIQTIITTTDLKNIDETILKDAKLIEIDSGTVVKINEEVK